MSAPGTLQRMRYRYIPDHLVGELLAKSWIDNAIPVVAFILVTTAAVLLLPNFLSSGSLSDLARQLAEFGLVALALTIVVIGGGIDLSVGSIFALCVLTTLTCMNVEGWSVGGSLAAALAVGAVCGALNGVLIGYLRVRAFITTLVTLVIFRSIYDIIFPSLASLIVGGSATSDIWDFFGFGTVLGVPASFYVFALIAVAWHLVLSRMRPGWRLRAVGGARRSAHNAGIDVRQTVCVSYIWSGLLTGIAAFLFSARLGSTGADTGVGLEISVLTAVVLGGTSLGGGRGSVFNAVIGAILVLMITNGLVRLGVPGSVNLLVLGLVLILAVFVDAKWVKNRSKILGKVYVSPTYLDIAAPTGAEAPILTPNDCLRNVETIGLGAIEGPEDVILDADDHLYCGTRYGTIVRFMAPDYSRHEVFAQIGGHPLGLAFDRDGNLVTCVGGMGVYKVSPAGEVDKVTDETGRSPLSIVDDSRLRLPDDLDIARDGRIFFSEATIRYEMSSWALDALEGRGNGRILCFDPRSGKTRTVLRNLVFPNGICMCPDGQSFLFAETWACRISRHWFEGPRSGKTEVVIAGLPGYPDNINRASDGHYWVALLGMRTKSFDLAMRRPGFRKRMARRIAPDQWLFPNINTGCVLKLSDGGKVLDSLWDIGGENHPMVTSMREHKGSLFLGGISNNRIGRYRLAGADPAWTATRAYWGRP